MTETNKESKKETKKREKKIYVASAELVSAKENLSELIKSNKSITPTVASELIKFGVIDTPSSTQIGTRIKNFFDKFSSEELISLVNGLVKAEDKNSITSVIFGTSPNEELKIEDENSYKVLKSLLIDIDSSEIDNIIKVLEFEKVAKVEREAKVLKETIEADLAKLKKDKEKIDAELIEKQKQFDSMK
ncbi:hypothetical protein EV201_1290 [Ancylomarina subtilis]|uniref:Uncharacterized protein n=1 Tax=Ancylomarina subtilis TaxID=1639035 RepID=A0A4Q7VKE1_9BACT|nr:hypothetical protein [Ancylomarina subtilis]RZT96649.1 hypothetical protein EV201_1290 [Ancylomarina subtilis]